jgi:DNA-directed RNA polymerase I, II, and III subunit RPABC2
MSDNEYMSDTGGSDNEEIDSGYLQKKTTRIPHNNIIGSVDEDYIHEETESEDEKENIEDDHSVEEEEEEQSDIGSDFEDIERMISTKKMGLVKNNLLTGGDIDDDEDDEDDDDDDDDYLKKFDQNIRKKIIQDYHPEMIQHNYEEIETLSKVVRNTEGIIIDPLHTTLPFLTKYEKSRILGERAKQLNAGAKAMIPVEPTVIDGYLIALAELEQKKIPFIIKRPLPNGGCEYWKLKDLEILG